MSELTSKSPGHGGAGTAERSRDLAGAGYERSDMTLRPFLLLVALLFTLTGLGIYSMLLVFQHYTRKAPHMAEPLSPLVKEGEKPTNTQPRIQPDPHGDLEAVRAEMRERRESYGWVNREAGTVRIPVERAKAILLERGLPARTGAVTAPNTTPVTGPGEKK